MSRSLPPLAGVFGALFLGVFAPGFAPTGEAGEPLFEKLAPSATGLDFSVPIDTKHPDKRLYYSAMACGGVAAGDLDGDGRPDLFFACGAAPNRLFLQSETPFAFADKTAPDLADDGSWCTGAAMVDIDNDGDLDLYVMRHDAPNRLWINESTPGRPVFTDRAAEHGLDIRDASLVATFHDYDRDGDPDLFLGMNAYYRQGGRPAGGVPMETLPDGQRRILPPWDRFFGVSGLDPDSGEPKYDEIGRPNRLLRNEGGRFADATRAAGLLADPSHTNAAAWWDFDADGWLDLHVSNDFADRDELYRNNRDGTFTEVAADRLQHTAWFSMGSAAEDINGDGLTDLLVADMLPTTHYRQKLTMGDMGSGFEQMFAEGLPIQKMVNTLFVNTGTGLCLEAAFQAGLAQTDWTWTAKSGDFDNDGRVDFYFPTGHSRDFNNSDLIRVTPAMRIGKNYWDFFEDAPELREKNLAFRNTAGHGGVPRFEKAADWGLGDEETMSFGAAVADFDRDGDLDLVTMNLGDPPAVFRNRTANRGLLVALHGARGNRFGLGARLCVEMADGTRQYRTLAPQNGYLESDEPLAHFGLGAADSAKALHVLWPGGARQRVENVAAGRRLDLDEPAPTVADASQASPFPEASPPKTRPLFRASGALLSIGVRETVFDDFLRQPLLPNRHSQLGPGQAWGDLDGDGAADLVIGSPKGAPTRVLIGRGLDPRGLPVFNLRRREPWIGPDAAHEDLGLLAFEADGDGDVDLYLVSGGVECEPGDASLADRLMLNDGTGKFSPAPAGALPAPPADDGFASGGVVTAADFDRDGDLDLFVGGRVVPGKYPLPARSSLLINDGKGRFAEGADTLAKGLADAGLVTGALWSDADGDGWLDLLVALEWGPVRLFHNRGGKALEDVTEAAGLAAHTGFWNSIAGRDLDGDGDIDYVAGNFGHNTKYHASPEKPELLYYGDFDGTGRPHLIEAKYGADGVCLPRRGFSCSSRAMPFLRDKVKTFHGFASSTLGDLYTPEKVETAREFSATTLDTSLLVNDGEGRFTVVPLPDLAQIAPVFGIVTADFDADGAADLFLAQNFHTPQIETGPMDGGLSLLLRGNPDAKSPAERFTPLWPLESGVVIPGDAMSAGAGDLNGDGRPDLVIGVNDGPPRLLLNTGGDAPGAPLRIVLRDPRAPGNPAAIGARVTVEITGLPPQVAEVQAGAGYLSQSEAALSFGWGKGAASAAKVIVRWPGDGSRTEHAIQRESAAPTVEIAR